MVLIKQNILPIPPLLERLQVITDMPTQEKLDVAIQEAQAFAVSNPPAPGDWDTTPWVDEWWNHLAEATFPDLSVSPIVCIWSGSLIFEL